MHILELAAREKVISLILFYVSTFLSAWSLGFLSAIYMCWIARKFKAGRRNRLTNPFQDSQGLELMTLDG